MCLLFRTDNSADYSSKVLFLVFQMFPSRCFSFSCPWFSFFAKLPPFSIFWPCPCSFPFHSFSFPGSFIFSVCCSFRCLSFIPSSISPCVTWLIASLPPLLLSEQVIGGDTEKKARLRRNVALEIIETERSYVKRSVLQLSFCPPSFCFYFTFFSPFCLCSLETLDDLYVYPLTHATVLSSLASSSSSPVSPESLVFGQPVSKYIEIFSSFASILQLNRKSVVSRELRRLNRKSKEKHRQRKTSSRIIVYVWFSNGHA